jgi:hypothetical protein
MVESETNEDQGQKTVSRLLSLMLVIILAVSDSTGHQSVPCSTPRQHSS